MTAIRLARRTMLFGGASLMVAPWLRPLSAAEVELPPDAVRFRPEIEPLVRLLETTPRERLFPVIAETIRNGTPYVPLLAATLLAGIRNVQPRPDVGFKFHCVMVVHAAHQATLAARDEHRWLPLFWSMDYFKRCQEQDRNEGDWTMREPNRAAIGGERAMVELREAMERWDVERADAAIPAAVAEIPSSRLLEFFARFGSRDFRNIGHKAIWVAGAFRTLETIGWEHAEPVLRSLAYAALNHSGQPNPADADFEADRAGRNNVARAERSLSDRPQRDDDGWVAEWMAGARSESPDGLAELTATGLSDGIAPATAFDAIRLAAAELVTRQPAIVPLHAMTSTHALHYLHRSVADERLRRWLLLQNASFLAHFRQAAAGRGALPETDLLALPAAGEKVTAPQEILERLGSDGAAASGAALGYLEAGGSAPSLLAAARELILVKGNDSHDYKYGEALFEEAMLTSPTRRARLIAGGLRLLTPASAPDNGLVSRLAEAFG